MEDVEALRRVFAHYVASERVDSPVGAVAQLVADGELSRETFARVLASTASVFTFA